MLNLWIDYKNQGYAIIAFENKKPSELIDIVSQITTYESTVSFRINHVDETAAFKFDSVSSLIEYLEEVEEE